VKENWFSKQQLRVRKEQAVFHGFDGWPKPSAFGARFPHLFLNLADSFLHFAFDLLGGITFDRSGNVIQFSFYLFEFSGSNVFTSHGSQLL